ncbi:MAG: hypothetical protein JWR38_5070 [Mucilaginibacter sp.]|nr:hypothetical protein [Mucilaginibacter sp.]
MKKQSTLKTNYLIIYSLKGSVISNTPTICMQSMCGC